MPQFLSDALPLVTLFAGVGSGAVIDTAQRRIPNEISLAMTAAGVAMAAMGLSGISLTASLAGLALGFALMLPGHVLGATGAGDVKFFAAAGAVLGVRFVIPAFFFTAIVGGAIAVVVAWRRGRLTRTMHLVARLCGSPLETKTTIESKGEHNRFPYGPAIAAGWVLAALIR